MLVLKTTSSEAETTRKYPFRPTIRAGTDRPGGAA